MSEQERWIVYPLLLMLVMMQVKDKLMGNFRTPRVQCQELVIEGPQKERLAAIQATNHGGSLSLFNAAGKVAAQIFPDAKGAGTFALLHDDKLLITSEMISDKQTGKKVGGVMRVHDDQGKVAAALYANEARAGTLATYLDDKPLATIDLAQHGAENKPTGGLFKLYDFNNQVSVLSYTGEDGAGNFATYGQGRPQVVIDSVNNAGRVSVLDRVADPTRAAKVIIAKETNDWGAAFVFGPDGMPHPLAHFTVHRVLPPGTDVLPIDPNTPLNPNKPLPPPPGQETPPELQAPSEQQPPAAPAGAGAQPADSPTEPSAPAEPAPVPQ